MKVEYNENLSKAYFNGYAFRRDIKTGYYLSSKKTDAGKRERLHCYVWRYFKGNIPEGYHVHHKDEDKSHNDIENLECIPRSKHLSFHGKERAITNHERIAKNLKENALPKAIEWHKSEAGREWHKNHYSSLLKRITVKCQFCGKMFETKNNGKNLYCSGSCKAAARRKSGVDNEERTCVICGNRFTTNKYSKARTCSPKCSRLCQSEKREKGWV